MFEAPITLLAGWLDGVHVESAAARAADLGERSGARNLGDTALSGVGDVARAAVHEAAHAVAAHLAGFKIDCARIRPDGTGGAVHYDARQDNVVDAFATVQVDLAGIATELLTGADRCCQFSLAHGYDLLTARLNIEKCRALAPSWELSHRTFAQMTWCLVAANQAAIQRVAACLRAVGELDGAEVAALCGHAQ